MTPYKRTKYKCTFELCTPLHRPHVPENLHFWAMSCQTWRFFVIWPGCYTMLHPLGIWPPEFQFWTDPPILHIFRIWSVPLFQWYQTWVCYCHTFCTGCHYFSSRCFKLSSELYFFVKLVHATLVNLARIKLRLWPTEREINFTQYRKTFQQRNVICGPESHQI